MVEAAPYSYIWRAYGLDFKPKQRVKHTVTGSSGTVKREASSMSHYVMVLFDGTKHALPCHPQELVEALPSPKHQSGE